MHQIAFVSQGRLYVQTPRGVREVKSHFGETIREREVALHQKNAWRTQGSGARFAGRGYGPGGDDDPAEMPIHVTSVAAGSTADEFLYTLETPAICGLLRSEKLGEEEQRLWHSNERRISDLSRHPTEPLLVCSQKNGNGTASIATLQADGSGLQRFTEGDSLDLSPRWVPGTTTRLVFQSAGVGRNRDGIARGLGPFAIHELDTAGGQLDVLVESATDDYLAPQFDGNGALYYIRRPYESGQTRPWWRTALDVLLLPWRLLQAIFGFFNFFSMIFAGKPLLTPAGGPPSQVDAGRMILWGNLVDARKAIRRARGDDAPDLVPKSWELIRRDPQGAETTLARNVLSYDLLGDGSIVYTNGSVIFQRSPSGAIERLAKHSFIEQLVVLDARAQEAAGS